MRALAVMLVVVSHAGLQDRVPGGSGVTIFFSISGFIITYLLLKEKSRTGAFNIGAFYTRRALKILPPLFVVVIIPTIILSFFKTINWSPVGGIIFFYYNWLKIRDVNPPLPGSVVVWSLSIEEQFYLLFAALWAVVVVMQIGIRWVIIGVIAAALTSTLIRIVIASTASFSVEHQDRIYYGSDTRVDAIAFGVLTAIAFHYAVNQPNQETWITRMIQKDSSLVLALVLFLASLILRNEWFRYTFRFSFQSLAACIVILYGFGTRKTIVRSAFNSVVALRPIQIIGLASYSIYLIHLI
ncbi:MAG: acyltransferase, partial [Verrucomicrobiaceae bacterium]